MPTGRQWPSFVDEANGDRRDRTHEKLDRLPSSLPPHIGMGEHGTEATILETEGKPDAADQARLQAELHREDSHRRLGNPHQARHDGGHVRPAPPAMPADGLPTPEMLGRKGAYP